MRHAAYPSLPRAALVLLFLLLFALEGSGVALAQDIGPGNPPSAPSRVQQVSSWQSVSVMRGADHFLYLPITRYYSSVLQVNPLSRSESLNFYRTNYLMAAVPMGWTGNLATCNPGSTSPDFKVAVLRRINYFRAMAGVPATVVFTEEANRKAQAAALMMSANNTLSHTPPTSWRCYSLDGAAGAGSSNLYLGVNGWDAITGYIRDPGSGNYFAGHRRWILYPQTREMGTGDIPAQSGYSVTNALHVFDDHVWESRPRTREEFVAWPPPGYVPYNVVFARWSFAYADADFSSAVVSMTENGGSISVAQSPIANGYGENTLVWIPKGMPDGAVWPPPLTDTLFRVTISNVVIEGQARNFTYDVIVFNPTP